MSDRVQRAADRTSGGYAGGGSPEFRKRGSLIDFYRRYHIAGDPGAIAVTDAEIDAFATEQPERHAELSRQPYGPKWLRGAIRRALQDDQRQTVEAAFVSGLREEAKVEVVDGKKPAAP